MHHYLIISRVHSSLTYPASFMLLSSMNPCPCGYFGDDKNTCQCTPKQIRNYLNKISGPLLDRIDIQIEVNITKLEDLQGTDNTETSVDIRKRVNNSRKIQLERYKNTNIYYNSQLTANLIKKYCHLGKDEEKLMEMAFKKMNLSARAYHRIIKLARTIADLDASDNINEMHLGEAIQYRSLDRKYWD